MPFRHDKGSLALALLILTVAPVRALTPPPQTYVLEAGHAAQVLFPASPILNLTPQYTIEMWFMNESGEPGAFLGKYIPNTSLTPYWFLLDTRQDSGPLTGTLALIYQQEASDLSVRSTVTSPDPFPSHTWVHIAVTSDGTTIRLFVNGTDVADTPSPGTPPTETSTPLQLGVNGSNQDFAIRQFRIWNTALSAAQIQATARSRLKGSEPGLVADWEFDGGEGSDGSSAPDRGPHGLTLNALTASSPFYTAVTRWIHTAALDAGPFFLFSGLQTVTSLPPNVNLGAGALFDFNGDGAIDALLGTYTPGEAADDPLVALRNDGSGHFADVSASIFNGPTPSQNGGSAFVSGDFNGDGRIDLFVACLGEGRVPIWGAQDLLFLQTPNGQLDNVTATNLPQVEAFSSDAKAADFRSLGIQDLFVLIKPFGPPIGPRYYVNDGSGHFTADTSRLPSVFLNSNAISPNSKASASDFVIGDFRGKGVSDVVLGTNANPPEQILINDGTGHFTFASTNPFPANNPGLTYGYDHIFSSDLNGDGKPDVLGALCPNPPPGCSLRLVLSNPDGSYRDASDQFPQDTWKVNYDTINKIYIVDVNGDGAPDLLFETFVPLLYLNTGDGHFVNASEILPIDLNGEITDIPGDLDHSGRVSIFSAGAKGNAYSVSVNVKNFTNFDLLKAIRVVDPVNSPQPVPIRSGDR